MKIFSKSILLSFLIIVGLISLIATSGPTTPPYSGPPTLWLITKNPVDEYTRMYNDAFVCKTDKVKLFWKHGVAEPVKLSAFPVENISPKLENKILSRNGSLEITVVDAAKLIVNYKNKLEKQIKLLPEDICTGFPMFPLGYYEGKLEQKQPIKQNSSETLHLFWNAETNSFKAQLAYIGFDCSTQAKLNQITCKQTKDGTDTKNVEILVNVSKDKLTGSYKGHAKTALSAWYPISGTISFSKMP